MVTEKAPRQCRFSKYGCSVKMRREELQLHEAKCPERTVRCPAPVFCDKFVQIKHCDEHLQSHLPSMWIHDSPNKSFVNTTVVNCGMNSPYLRDCQQDYLKHIQDSFSSITKGQFKSSPKSLPHH